MALVTVTLNGANNAANDTLIRNAITNSADGDVIVLNNDATTAAGGLKTVTLTDSLVIANKAISVRGSGNRDLTLVAAAGKPIFEVQHTGNATYDRLEFLNMTLTGNSTATAAIYFNYTAPAAGSARKFDHVRITNLNITNFNVGISALIPYTDDNRCVCTLWTIDNCEISACRQYGIWVNNVSNCAVRNSEIKTCALHGINAYLCPNISIRDSIVDGCNTDLIVSGSSLEGGAQMLVKLCHPFTISNVLVRNLPTNSNAAKTGLCLSNCNGGFVEGFSCECPSVGGLGEDFFSNSIGIQLTAAARGVKLESMVHKWIRSPIVWDKSCDPPVYEQNQIVQSQPSDLSVRGNSYIV